MSYEAEGKLVKKFDTEKKTETFSTREFVITVGDQYPQFIKFQLTQDRCGIVDPYNEGDMIKVYFDLRGREWNEKYFTNLNAWRVENVGQSVAPGTPGAASTPTDGSFPGSQDEVQSVEADDDLPF